MRISIPKPCNEDWDEMSPEQQGAFCKVCSKVVVDFSKMSDDEVLAYFEKKKEEKTCGRFRNSQLSPYEMKINLRAVATQGSFPKIFAVSLFLFFSSLFICKSDTGDRVLFQMVEMTDTASAILQMKTGLPDLDTAISGNTSSNCAITEIDTAGTQIEPGFIAGGAVVSSEVKPIDTVEISTPPINVQQCTLGEPVLRGEVYIKEEPILKGKVVCNRPTKKENEKIIKHKGEEQKKEREKRIMGDLEL